MPFRVRVVRRGFEEIGRPREERVLGTFKRLCSHGWNVEDPDDLTWPAHEVGPRPTEIVTLNGDDRWETDDGVEWDELWIEEVT